MEPWCSWLKRSPDAVKEAHLPETLKDLQRKVSVADRQTTVDGLYLRIIIHANEPMGQLIAYARLTSVVPPWAQLKGLRRFTPRIRLSSSD